MIEFRSVTKRFAKGGGLRSLLPFGPRTYVTALDGISFRCERGDVLGVLGPNGAGKTTTAKIIANLILPDAGEVWLCGERLTGRRHDLRGRVGYVNCDERSFFWRLTGRQNLHFFLALGGHDSDRRALELAEYFDLGGKLDVAFGKYSTGMRKKLSLVRGLMGDPEVVLFDEATNGLDPRGVIKLKKLLRDECSGKAIVWTTHRLEEINELCNTVLAIKDGGAAFAGSIGELRARHRLPGQRVTITVRGDVEEIRRRARAMFRPERESRRDSQYAFTLAEGGAQLYDRVLRLLSETRSELVGFEQAEVSMGDIYFSMMES